MTKLVCQLECGHEIMWGESPETPGAALPRVGQIVWCPECESDEEIVQIVPTQVITINEEENGKTLHVFYDCDKGMWGFCVSETAVGQYSETDDVIEFESEKAALESGRRYV